MADGIRMARHCPTCGLPMYLVARLDGSIIDKWGVCSNCKTLHEVKLQEVHEAA